MRRFSIGSLLPVLAVATFAATPVPVEDDPWKSETFLSDYSRLKPVRSAEGQDYVWAAPLPYEMLSKFDAIMVDQPEISISPDSPYRCAKPDDLRAIAEFTRRAVVERLKSRGFNIVEEKGERVLYIRMAITDLQLKKKKRGILSYTPIGAIVHEVKDAVRGVMKEVDIIDLAGQAEVSVSTTGEMLGAMVAKRGVVGGKTGSGKLERMTFDEFKSRVESASDRLVCRMDNARRPPDQRVDCWNPASQDAPAGESSLR